MSKLSEEGLHGPSLVLEQGRGYGSAQTHHLQHEQYVRNSHCRDGVALVNRGQAGPAGRSVNHGSRRNPPPLNDAVSVSAASADTDASSAVTASRSTYTSRFIHDTQTGGPHRRCPRVSARKRRRAAGRPQLLRVCPPPLVQAAGVGAAARRSGHPLAQTAYLMRSSHVHRVPTGHFLLHVAICCKLCDSKYNEQSLKNFCEAPMGCVSADEECAGMCCQSDRGDKQKEQRKHLSRRARLGSANTHGVYKEAHCATDRDPPANTRHI